MFVRVFDVVSLSELDGTEIPSRLHPNMMDERPPGGCVTFEVGRSVNTFPVFCECPDAKSLLEGAFSFGSKLFSTFSFFFFGSGDSQSQPN